MAVSSKESPRPAILNLPNQLTSIRFVLAMVLVAVLAWEQYLAGLIIFVVAASTDWLDGYLARKYGLVTMLGRILDPFVDKIIMCGTFICLSAIPTSGIKAWMTVVIVGRELLVTALRSFLEQQGADFSASFSGKVKMVVQCIAAGLSLYMLAQTSPAAWVPQAVTIAAWAAVVLTLYSGAGYVLKATSLLKV